MRFKDFESLNVGDRVSHCPDCRATGVITSAMFRDGNDFYRTIVWDSSDRPRRYYFDRDDLRVVVERIGTINPADPSNPMTVGDIYSWSRMVTERLKEREAHSPHWNPYPDGEG